MSLIIRKSSKLAQQKSKRIHDNIDRYINWELCGKFHLETVRKGYEYKKRYKHKPDGVTENKTYNILLDMNVQCDQVTEVRRPDIVFINKEGKGVKIIDVAVPGDMTVNEK